MTGLGMVLAFLCGVTVGVAVALIAYLLTILGSPADPVVTITKMEPLADKGPSYAYGRFGERPFIAVIEGRRLDRVVDARTGVDFARYGDDRDLIFGALWLHGLGDRVDREAVDALRGRAT